MLEIDEYKPKIIKAIEYHYPQAKVYLFGSWATGRNRPHSDIDLAIDAGEPIDLYEVDRIKRTIDNLDFPHSFDVVDLQSATGDFKTYDSERDDTMERVILRFKVLKQALATLNESNVRLPTMHGDEELYKMIRDSQIQRFEYCHEAFWQFLKNYLLAMYGKDTEAPNSVFRMAYNVGFLSKQESTQFLKMAQDRNLTSHTYIESLAERISAHIEGYYHDMQAVAERLEPEMAEFKL